MKVGTAGAVVDQSAMEHLFRAPAEAYCDGTYTARAFHRDAAGNDGTGSGPLIFSCLNSARVSELPYRTRPQVTMDAALLQ